MGVVEDGDGGQIDGGTAGVWGPLTFIRDAIHELHQGLDEGVVGGVHLGVQGEDAVALAVVGVVALRSDDPVLPAEVLEGHVQVLQSAPGVGADGAVCDLWTDRETEEQILLNGSRQKVISLEECRNKNTLD